MKQALHIFKKDSRYLWPEVSLLLALISTFAWLAGRPLSEWIEILIVIAAAYVIARAIHAEAIPGDNQFWLTRPYERKSLFGAKLLFILAYISLPVFTAQSLILKANGFSLFASLPGLLWSQLLMLLGLWLPTAALAALTAGIVPFIFSTLSLVALGFVIQEIMMVPPSFAAVRGLLVPVQWVWDTMAVFFLVAIVVPVFYLQYKRRRTLFSRVFAIAATILGAAAYLYVPWPAALAIETEMPKRAIFGSPIHVALDLNSKPSLEMKEHGTVVWLHLPLAVTGVREGVDVRAEALSIAVYGPNGRIWQTGPYKYVPIAERRNHPAGRVFDADVRLDRSFYDKQATQAVTLRGALFLSFFAPLLSEAISLDKGPVDATDGLRCSMGHLTS